MSNESDFQELLKHMDAVFTPRPPVGLYSKVSDLRQTLAKKLQAGLSPAAAALVLDIIHRYLFIVAYRKVHPDWRNRIPDILENEGEWDFSDLPDLDQLLDSLCEEERTYLQEERDDREGRDCMSEIALPPEERDVSSAQLVRLGAALLWYYSPRNCPESLEHTWATFALGCLQEARKLMGTDPKPADEFLAGVSALLADLQLLINPDTPEFHAGRVSFVRNLDEVPGLPAGVRTAIASALGVKV